MDYAWSKDNPDQWDPERDRHPLRPPAPDARHGAVRAQLLARHDVCRGAAGHEPGWPTRWAKPDLADKCERLGKAGAAYIDDELYNGRYFFQAIDLDDKSVIARFDTGRNAGVLADSFMSAYWSDEHGEIKYQFGEGCIADQILGQWHAEVAGLGLFLDADKVALGAQGRATTRTSAPTMADHFNPCRNYAYEDEGGLLIATYPEGTRQPMVAAPYAEEVWTGIEYASASHMIMHGLVERGARRRPRRARIATTARAATRGTTSNAAPTTPARCRPGSWSTPGPASTPTWSTARCASRRRATGDYRLFWSAGTAWGELVSTRRQADAQRARRRARLSTTSPSTASYLSGAPLSAGADAGARLNGQHRTQGASARASRRSR